MGKLVACWDKEGNMKMKSSVDARECVDNLGFSMEEPEAKREAPKAKTEKKEKARKG